MAMKKIVLLLTYLFASVPGQAQGAESVDSLNDINVIKRDTSYIYAEATMKDAIEAQSSARGILELKLYEWLRNKYPGLNADSLVNLSKESWHDLVTRRGKYKRVFVFVSKDRVLPVVEEPESVKEELSVPELTADEERMADIYDFTSIEPYINGLKYGGRLKAYGKYASLPEETPCYLFVCNGDGEVVAVLRQAEDGSYFNLREKKDDNVRNYKNCGAIWFQLKEKQNN